MLPRTSVIRPIAGDHGRIFPAENFQMTNGSSELLQALPEAGYNVEKWTVNGIPQESSGEFFLLEKINTTTEEYVVKVTFKLISSVVLREAIVTVTAEVVGRAKLVPYPFADPDGKMYQVPLYNMVISGTTSNGQPQESKPFKVVRFGVARGEKDVKPYVYGIDPGSYVISEWIPGYATFGAWRVQGKHWLHAGKADPKVETGLAGCLGVYGQGTLKAFNKALCEMMGTDDNDKSLVRIAGSGKFKMLIAQATKPPLKEWQ